MARHNNRNLTATRAVLSYDCKAAVGCNAAVGRRRARVILFVDTPCARARAACIVGRRPPSAVSRLLILTSSLPLARATTRPTSLEKRARAIFFKPISRRFLRAHAPSARRFAALFERHVVCSSNGSSVRAPAFVQLASLRSRSSIGGRRDIECGRPACARSFRGSYFFLFERSTFERSSLISFLRVRRVFDCTRFCGRELQIVLTLRNLRIKAACLSFRRISLAVSLLRCCVYAATAAV